MSTSLVNCLKISVDCVANDPVDIRCGGPKYLGFDFFVQENLAEEMQKYIMISLEALNIPLKKIYISDKLTLNEKEVWTKDRIFKAIIENENYLKSVAERNYDATFKR